MSVPSRAQCYELLKAHKVPSHIIRHSEIVAKVATLIAAHLRKAGVNVNPGLAEAGALLHDLDKVESLKNGGHGEQSSAALTSLGYPEVARIAFSHVLEAVLESGKKPVTWEEKIVYYADKRVQHDQIVSLQERIADLQERYGSKSPAAAKSIKQSAPLAQAIERELMEKAGMRKEDIA